MYVCVSGGKKYLFFGKSYERIKSMNPSNSVFYFEAFQYTKFSNRHLLVQNQQLKHQRNVWNLFKVNNRGTRTTPLEIYLLKGEFSKKNVILNEIQLSQEMISQLIFACLNWTMEIAVCEICSKLKGMHT